MRAVIGDDLQKKMIGGDTKGRKGKEKETEEEKSAIISKVRRFAFWKERKEKKADLCDPQWQQLRSFSNFSGFGALQGSWE